MPVFSLTVNRISLCCLLLIIIGDVGCVKSTAVVEQQPDTIPKPPVDTTPKDTVKPLAAIEFLNEPYGKDGQQVMDIYLPAGRTAAITKVMVFIHGGGWTGSDKSDYTSSIDGMKNQNAYYAFVNINYRLVKDGKNIFPAAEEDINTALEYIWGKVDSFHISPLTALVGTSAGAHLAALQACKHNQKGYIRSVACVMGIYDMKRLYDEGSAGVAPMTVSVLGGTPDEKAAIYHSSSPVFFVTPQTPATILIHGTEDTLARYSQALEMDSALNKAGVVHSLYSYKGYHSIPAEKANEAADKMFSFLATYTK
jgi:acetyl esterase/lipase